MSESALQTAEEDSSTTEVWKQALADYDGRRFVSWPAAKQELEDLFSARARELPPGVTAEHLVAVALGAGWLQEEEGMVVLRIPKELWEVEVRPQPPLRKSPLA